MNWLYNNKELNEVSDEVFGFVYKITCNKTGRSYIGKKQTVSVRNVPLTKKDILEWKESHTGGRAPKKKQVIKPSKWQNYWGSNPDFLIHVKEHGMENFTREVLKLCYNKKQLTYWETKYQFMEGVLESNDSFCDNILGKFFRKDLE